MPCVAIYIAPDILEVGSCVSDRFPPAAKTGRQVQARPCWCCHGGGLIITLLKLAAAAQLQHSTAQHRHQGLRNEAGHALPHAVVPAVLIRVRARHPASLARPSTRNRLSAPGSPTHVGPTPTPPRSSHGCRPLRNAGTAPKWNHAFFLPSPRIRQQQGVAPRRAPGRAGLHTHTRLRPTCTVHVLHQTRRPACCKREHHALCLRSLKSVRVQSSSSFPPPPFSLFLYTSRDLGSSGTLWYGRHRMTSWNGSLSASRQRPGRCYRMPRILVPVPDRKQPPGLADLDSQ